MKIFSKNRKKIEPYRRFGSRQFQEKIKVAAGYKRVFNSHQTFSDRSLFRRWILSPGFWLKIGIGIIVLVIYFLIVSSIFVISDIEISGNSTVSTQQIRDTIDQAGNSRFFLIKKNNFFLFSRGNANKLLTSIIPSIKEITDYHRAWPNKVSIVVKERVPGFVILSNERYFLVDDEGVVVQQLENSKDYLIVENQLVEDFASSELLPSPKLAPFIISMSKQWNSKVSTNIKTVKFPGKGSNEVHFETEEGWTVMFDTTRSVTTQLSDLALILNKQVPLAERSRLAYIDLRLSKWAYYCFKASPCYQQEQPLEAGATTDVETQ